MERGSEVSSREEKVNDDVTASRGLVCNIEHFALHDGPGIRTLVFMQGCPLRCLWCANPETQGVVPELLFHSERCTHCGICVTVCPQGASTLTQLGDVDIDRQVCKACGVCVEACLSGARVLSSRRMTVEEVLKDIRKDMPFYRNTGGGVTLSGGEPLMQWEFARSLLAECKRLWIHTAVETCGYHAKWQDISSVLENVDLLFFDLKHMDPTRHRELTGKSNGLILSNLRSISQSWHGCLVVRMPVIPTYNDSEEDVKAVAEFIATNRISLERLELLPFHRLGAPKYNALGRAYAMEGLDPPSRQHLDFLLQLIRERGLTAEVVE